MTKCRIITIITATLLLTTSLEINHAVAYTVAGNGTRSCGSWTEDRIALRMAPRGTEPRTIAWDSMGWILGFLSGVGFAGDHTDPLHGIDNNAVMAWIDNYCRNNPLKDIGDAAAGLAIAHPG